MAVFVRVIHVASVSYLLGGALLIIILFLLHRHILHLDRRALLDVAGVYELGFWLAVGLLVMTGVGNLGAIGEALPPSGTEWSRILLVKLALVLTFLALSAVRSMSLALLNLRPQPAADRAAIAAIDSLGMLYGATGILLVAALMLAVTLAH
jgi:putative copper export protein